ncbi:dienelactone hydrolase [Micromonospora kangleipakensis]|uniref:Dienelactone hydrolase n=1 Tax=Micromonospora kangleipakensis TaxID=1077942 RepID=A0A4Q8BEG0_9ACTN|nr:alpha/beta hydrolase [Micromonospora kangleipakensis]RZU76320.1 dienelactone hydrolase [Micromonospora kangleipakensis]
MHSVRFTAETSSDGVVERDFLVGEIPGVLWAPVSGADHAPIVLVGHNGGMHKKAPGLRARALHTAATWGFNVVAIDAPGHGDRPRTDEDEQARTEIRQAMTAGDTPRFAAASVRFMASVAERAVPEWQATLDALQALPQIGPDAPVGYGGGISMGTSIGVRLTAAEPRITAAIFGGGFFVDEPVIMAARQITVPVQFLLPWDDEHVDRSSGFALFDAFASAEKTLHANPGDHRSVRWVGVDDTFLSRHLGRA